MRALYIAAAVTMAGVSSVFALLAELEERYQLPTSGLGWIAGSAFAAALVTAFRDDTLVGSFNNVCIGDLHVTGASCDGQGFGYFRDKLAATGFVQGETHEVPGTELTFDLPDVETIQTLLTLVERAGIAGAQHRGLVTEVDQHQPIGHQDQFDPFMGEGRRSLLFGFEHGEKGAD